jgi:NADH-quinone oxidoreductase subunit F
MQQNFRIKNRDDLLSVREAFVGSLKDKKHQIIVCSGAGCISSNCHAVRDALVSYLGELGLAEEVRVIETGCIGTCDLGPVMIISDTGRSVLYTKLTPQDMQPIIDAQLVQGRNA